MDYVKSLGRVVAIVGSQWGDEGKGKLTDILAENFAVIVRSTGGSNAGHTIKVGEQKFVFHLLPSGILHKTAVCLISNGCVVHLPTLLKEIEKLNAADISVEGRLFLSDRAHLVFDFHQEIDALQEEAKGANKVGTTKKGIGPAYTDKVARVGIRVGDLLDTERFAELFRRNVEMHRRFYAINVDVEAELKLYLEELLPKFKAMITDTTAMLKKYYDAGKNVLLEGANATHLDVDHGTYPFVTSSNPVLGGMATGCGMSPRLITDAIGIVKAYTSRVGEGPFLTELHDELGEQIRERGMEYGSTTGRPRRCGWLDLNLVRASIWLNSLTELNLTKLDVLTGIPELNVAVDYIDEATGQVYEIPPADLSLLAKLKPRYQTFPGWTEDLNTARSLAELPENARNYVNFIAEKLGVPVRTIGVGQRRDEMIYG
jgi:adenylosuccinate synthase